jgi:hypothetical protein
MFTMSLQGVDQFAPLAGVKTRYTPSRFTLDGYQNYPRLQITGTMVRSVVGPGRQDDQSRGSGGGRRPAPGRSGTRGSRRVAARQRGAGHERVTRGPPAGDRGFVPCSWASSPPASGMGRPARS